MTKVKFREWNCQIKFAHYKNRRIAIQLMNDDPITEDGFTSPPGTELIATATINVPDANLPDGYVIIKDYSENEGMYKALVEAGVIDRYVSMLNTGFVAAPICKLLIPVK